MKSLLRMCKREQIGDDLRRAVRDLVPDENLDDRTAPAHHLDFEIVAPGPTFLLEVARYLAGERGAAVDAEGGTALTRQSLLASAPMVQEAKQKAT